MIRRRIVLTALLCVSCVGPGEQAPPAPAPPAIVRAALAQDPASLSLLGKSDRVTEIVAFQITDALVQYDPQLRLVPRVAESWRWSADRTELEFRLREGVRWHETEIGRASCRERVFTAV